MKKQYNLVDCDWCRNWKDAERTSKLCDRCNNSKKVVDPKDIRCNMCGETMCPIGTMNEQIPHGLNKAHVTGGYDSYHLSDMSRYTFSFCEKCLRHMFMACKIKPDIHEMNFEGDAMSEEVWADDQKHYEYRVWKDDGGHHQAYVDGKCNERKDCSNDAVFTKLYNGNTFSEDCSCQEHKYTKDYASVHYVKFIPHVLRAFL